MGVILDTTAVVGLLELAADRPLLADAIRRHSGPDELPRVHLVTLGELRAGVEQASTSGDRSVTDTRTATLRTATSQRFHKVTIEEDDWQWFGSISAHMSRRPTHNDKWIVAAALSRRLTLITQDEAQADRASQLPDPPTVKYVARRA